MGVKIFDNPLLQDSSDGKLQPILTMFDSSAVVIANLKCIALGLRLYVVVTEETFFKSQ